MHSILVEAITFLAAVVVAVPLSKRLGLGSVLGYLIAGIVIGPMTGLIGDETEGIQSVAEFGVVMMLFLIGLELQPSTLWQLRHKLVGLGGLQVGLTIAIITLVAMFFGLPWKTALAISFVLSLSSTAIVLQTLHEKGLKHTRGGQASFSVLLSQDIAVIPILGLLPLLALPSLMETEHATGSHGVQSLLSGLPAWIQTLAVLATIGFIIACGQYLAKPAFRYIALARLREVFTAFALLLVVGISLMMISIGLSPALGTFIAGVVLANSEYRHELESNIEPFKGLLLGIFFITVGAGINVDLLADDILQILGLTAVIILAKFAVLLVLGKAFRLKGPDLYLFAIGLAQVGEFGFVLLSFSEQNNVLPHLMVEQLMLVVAMSMLMTPLLFIILEHLILAREKPKPAPDTGSIKADDNIILAGNGRFGHTINRLLLSCGYSPTVIDLDVATIDGFNQRGYKTYFGDASRPELLAAAGIDDAKLMIVAIDDRDRAIDMIRHIRNVRVDLPIIVRAFDRVHCFELYQAGATEIIRETFDSSLRAGKAALTSLGLTEDKATAVTELFRQQETFSVREMACAYDPSLSTLENQAMSKISMEIEKETAEKIKELLQKQ